MFLRQFRLGQCCFLIPYLNPEENNSQKINKVSRLNQNKLNVLIFYMKKKTKNWLHFRTYSINNITVNNDTIFLQLLWYYIKLLKLLAKHRIVITMVDVRFSRL